MPGVKLRFHPLFFAAGVLSAFTGDLMLFLAAVFAALLHECAHAFAARRYGFVLDRIVLMPYGAVVSGDISGMRRRQELAVLLAGPLANAACALLFAALWWLWPETYPYTDTAAQVSCSLFLVNLLPACPLDGGRILRLLLAPLGARRAQAICTAVTVAIASGVLVWFSASCFSRPAWSALLFGVMLLFGLRGGTPYARLSFARAKSFARGIEERRVALSAACTVQDALRFLCEERYLVLVLFEGEEFLGELSEEEYLTAVRAGEFSRPLRECLPKL